MKLLFIFALAMAGQQPKLPPGTTANTGAATANGQCSLANSGTADVVTINCGIGVEQGKKLMGVLNKILANQLPPDVVLGKLDDIIRELKAGGGLRTDVAINNSGTIANSPTVSGNNNSGVQIGTVGALTLGQAPSEIPARIRSDVAKLIRYPAAIPDDARARTTTERLLAEQLPGRVFDLLMPYEEKDILATPEIGVTLLGFRTKYYQFRQSAEGLENRSLPRIGQMVTVRFREAWRIYYVYAIMRFGGVSKDQIIADGNFLNYDITWDDAERVFGDLAKDPSVVRDFSEFFASNRDLIETVRKVAVMLQK